MDYSFSRHLFRSKLCASTSHRGPGTEKGSTIEANFIVRSVRDEPKRLAVRLRS
jgi:hypothetical protein